MKKGGEVLPAMNIRELFHSVGNIHNLLTVGSGVTKDLAQECLEDRTLSQDLREKINKIVNDLDSLTNEVQRANKELREIHDRVYAVIDPDTEKPK